MGGAAYERNTSLPKTVAKGWRILYEEYKKGLLEDYYNSKILEPEELADALNQGKVCRDTRLRDFLKEQKIVQ